MIPMWTPAGDPTELGLRANGGKGFDAIWCAASVMPYASTRGTPNTSSILCITSAESGVLHDRMKRSESAPVGFPFFPARANKSWWIVGTPEYQLTRCSPTILQNDRASNFAGTTTVPPDKSAAIVEAIRPCT